MTPGAFVPQDWAPYGRLEDAVRASVRDADVALDALAGVVDLDLVVAFTLERLATPQPWGEALWQEIAVTDGHRLILWHGDDEPDAEDVLADGSLLAGRSAGPVMFTSAIRTVPLSAVVDQGLRHRFRVDPDGSRTMHGVNLYLATQTPERSMTELTEANETRSVQYVETYRFSKSVNDGGLAQMQRLLQFGRAMSRLAGAARP